MNAENAEYQILLALQSSHHRSRELDSLHTAIGALVCSRSSRESRTLRSRAYYLTLLAARLERLLCDRCNQALRGLSSLVTLPDELQWEYRSAHSLGVAQAISHLALLQDEIIGEVRQSLADVCALLMAQAPDLQLSIHANDAKSGRLDPINAVLLALSPRLGRSMLDLIARAAAESKIVAAKAYRSNELPDSDRSIAAILSASANLTEAELLAEMVAFCLEATIGGAFNDEPSELPIGEKVGQNERIVARLFGAGFVAARVSALYQRQNPTLCVALN
jgi:hypothetical protein